MDLLQSFKKYLDLRQVPYQVDEDVVSFSIEGWHFLLLYDRDTPNYFRLALPKLVAIDENFSIAQYKKALRISAEYKVAKAAIFGESLWFVFENFLPDYDSMSSKIFERAIRILMGVGKDWRGAL